nr:GPN-loop GTPase 2-like isoform X1 [Hydra vulgaris]
MNLTTFGQVVLGPPGSGKSTYCAAIKNFLTGIGRKVIIVNLDPANDNMPFVPDICITSLVTLSDVMDLLKLGPNGGLVYCMEFLEKNFDVIEKKLKEFQGCYIIFDCPGQVELFTHQNSIKNIFQRLQKLDFRLAAVHLVDSHYCNDSAKFISVLMTSLSTMLQIELPHINVLSKIDLVEKYGKLAFSMDYFTDVMDLNYLLDIENDDVFVKKFRKLNEAMISIIQDYSLVSFSVLNVQSKESMLNLMKIIDKANGYFYGGLSEESDDVMKMMSQAVGVDLNFNDKIKISCTKIEIA